MLFIENKKKYFINNENQTKAFSETEVLCDNDFLFGHFTKYTKRDLFCDRPLPEIRNQYGKYQSPVVLYLHSPTPTRLVNQVSLSLSLSHGIFFISDRRLLSPSINHS